VWLPVCLLIISHLMAPYDPGGKEAVLEWGLHILILQRPHYIGGRPQWCPFFSPGLETND
jgi:hypothetical protein